MHSCRELLDLNSNEKLKDKLLQEEFQAAGKGGKREVLPNFPSLIMTASALYLFLFYCSCFLTRAVFSGVQVQTNE